MVDVRATNAKLRRRAVRIVRDAAAVDEELTVGALAAAHGHANTAIVTLLAGVDTTEAAGRLERAGGRIRDAINATQKSQEQPDTKSRNSDALSSSSVNRPDPHCPHQGERHVVDQ
jgi:ATP/maltotriose-dependent transcriptional regulator MalT